MRPTRSPLVLAPVALALVAAVAAPAFPAPVVPGAAAAFGSPPALHAQEAGAVTVEVGVRNPAVSPDGSTLAVSVLGSVFTVPAGGGEALRVTGDGGWDRHPAWSPDGRFLAYSRWTPGGAQLVVRTLTTGLERVAYQAPREILQVEYGPDGRWLWFVDQRSQYEAHLWRVPVGGGEAEQLTFTEGWHEWSFAVAPDGERVLLETGRFDGTDLFELDVATKEPTRLTATPERETAVAWSADGATRAWIARRNGVDRVMVSAAGAAAREIHRAPYGQSELTFGPDGSLWMVNGRRLYRLDPATGAAREVPVSATFERAAEPADDLLITNVRPFDGVGDAVTEDAWVRVADGRIERVGTGSVEPPAGVPVIDGRGRTLLPGLMDNHYHFWSPWAGPRLLAAGVTALRDPGVAIADGMDYKDASALGLLAAPRIFSAGPLIDGPSGYHPMVDVSMDDPAAAAALVRGLHAQGVDALKAYFLLEPDVLRAVVAEADAVGIPVAGHIGVRTSWSEAMDAGIDGFNHVRVWKDFLDPDTLPDGSDGSLDSGRDRISRMQADWSAIDPDSPEVEALLARMAETGTAFDPTLFIQRIDDDAREDFGLEAFARARQSYERMGAFVRRAVEAGVPLLAGTDNVGLNNELEAYAEAGVPAAEILKAATINGARWIGADDEMGTVEVGKRADLLLVDGDPLEDVKALREVDLVLKDGVVVFRRGG